MSRFGGFDFGEDVFGDGGLPSEPDITESRVAWQFYDGVTNYELPVNPQTASMPTLNKRLTHKVTCAGRQITYEGRPEVGTFSISGVILEEAQYRAFQTWVGLKKQVRITDDLGEKYWVYIKTFSPKRRRDITYPWLMDFTIDGSTLDRGAV